MSIRVINLNYVSRNDITQYGGSSIDIKNIYLDNGNIWSGGKVIVSSENVKAQLEKPHLGLNGDYRSKKIYQLKVIANVLIDNINYCENGNSYFSIDFKTKLKNGKYVLEGFDNYNGPDNIVSDERLDKTNNFDNKKINEDKIQNEEIDSSAIYMDNGELWIGGPIIAVSDKVIKELEQPSYDRESWDSREEKIYTLYALNQFVDDIGYTDENGEKQYNRDFQTVLINGKNTLVGFNNYITDEIKKSRSLSPGTEIFDVATGKSISTLTSRLSNNTGWNVDVTDNSNLLFELPYVHDSDYGYDWSDKLRDDIIASRQLSIGKEIFGKNGKSWSTLVSRLDDNLGWKLSSGSKALDSSYNKKWFTK